MVPLNVCRTGVARQFLISEYAGEKAVFVKDVEHYKGMRFESARKLVARCGVADALHARLTRTVMQAPLRPLRCARRCVWLAWQVNGAAQARARSGRERDRLPA